ncbi:MAG TPA: glyoxalase/bleomycin resistance/extradiol dioxygenase family protein [Stellaceae bacterium]|nr:glyoxalase/bleomycin resistance/extradiol dioxygenase family protein [Stellaceae bacterium]
MQLNPYLSFDGKCADAFKFYEKVLGGQIVALLTYADTPMAAQVAPEERGKIVHARLLHGDKVLMGSDAPPGRYEPMKGFSVTLGIDEPEEAERVFRDLAAGGTVTMPIAETFWAHRFGMLVDRFGTPWMVNCEKPM